MKRYRSLLTVIIVTALVTVMVGMVQARIPEPGNILYGIMPAGGNVISLEVNDQEIVSYTMGDNINAGEYFVLRVPMDALAPLSSGSTRPGDVAELFVDGEPIEPLTPLIIAEKGTVKRIYFQVDDWDGDGKPDENDNCPADANADQSDIDDDGIGDVCDNCPAIANTTQGDVNNNGQGDACDLSDSDGDGYSDMLEYEYSQSGRPDLDGNPYDPLVANAPGDEGYNPSEKRKSIWLLMLPAILSGAQSQ